MNYNAIKIINDPPSKLFSDERMAKDIKSAKEIFGINTTYPKECIKYLQHFGIGLLGGLIIIYPPNKSYQLTHEYLNHFLQHKNHLFLIDKSDLIKGIKAKRVSKIILKSFLFIGRTEDGEPFYFDGKYYYVNHWSFQPFTLNRVGKTLNDLFTWYSSGLFIEKNDLSFFEVGGF